MNEEVLHIKNMVGNLCITVVRSELEKIGIEPLAVELGEVYLKEKLSNAEKEKLTGALLPFGFSLIDDKKEQTIEQVKNLIRELVHCNYDNLKINLSEHISSKIGYDYNCISTLFSESEGITIEKYFIAHKIEKVKEFIVCGNLTLNEIAYKLNYSSVAYLSSQFKKVTGVSPSEFKQTKKRPKRIPLEKL